MTQTFTGIVLSLHVNQSAIQYLLKVIFCMVIIYNNLPQAIVDCSTITEFQSILTAEVENLCQLGSPNWRYHVSSRRLAWVIMNIVVRGCIAALKS